MIDPRCNVRFWRRPSIATQWNRLITLAGTLLNGTLDVTLDPTGYVETSLEPTVSAWLPSGADFCAFSFELSATDRKTTGYGPPGGRTLWRGLIGISYTPPTP